jgi:VIT1/CCC1 family predicted Fe2+/Mn2+ transporter
MSAPVRANPRPSRPARHGEQHRASRIGWLRAAVLGANDGLVSTSSLVIGVAASKASGQAILVAGVAGLVAGAMSMAAGEYVSVSSQSDTERADLARERTELASAPDEELDELTGIYVARGVSPELARQVAIDLTAKDALAAHARDELGFTGTSAAKPLQAAAASAATFAVGAIVPLLITVLVPRSMTTTAVSLASIVTLAGLGAAAAHTGGAPLIKGIVRVTLWGALAMAVTAAAGLLFGASG